MKNEIIALLKRQENEDCIPAHPEQVQRVERHLGRSLPPPFTHWLMFCNGSRGGQGGVIGIEQIEGMIDLEANLTSYPSWNKFGWTPVATDGCGNRYVLVQDPNVPSCFPVCFIDMALDSDTLAYAVGSHLEIFLKLILWRELDETDGWPFDKTWMVQHDPDITKVSVAPLPWNVD
ncbi:MAG: SMI1/KNR4 family protein [Verrucomicrobiales bacterium]